VYANATHFDDPEIYSPVSYVYSSNARGCRVETQGNTHFENVWRSK